MSRGQTFPPFDGQVRNQYEIWAYNMFTETWAPFDDTYSELEIAKDQLRHYIYQGFTVKLVTVQYTVIEVL